MKELESNYDYLEPLLRYHFREISLSIEAHRVDDVFGLFIVFYKWIIKDNNFIAAYDDKKSFEKCNIQEFKDFFMDQNDDSEELMPSDTILKMFFWQVINNGFNKHLRHIEKLHPELFTKDRSK